MRPLVLQGIGALATMAGDHTIDVVHGVDVVMVEGLIDHIGANVRVPDDADLDSRGERRGGWLRRALRCVTANVSSTS